MLPAAKLPNLPAVSVVFRCVCVSVSGMKKREEGGDRYGGRKTGGDSDEEMRGADCREAFGSWMYERDAACE